MTVRREVREPVVVTEDSLEGCRDRVQRGVLVDVPIADLVHTVLDRGHAPHATSRLITTVATGTGCATGRCRPAGRMTQVHARTVLYRLAALAVLAILAMVSLSGCVRVRAALAVSEDDLVSGQVIIAALPTKPGDTGPALTIVPELAGKVRTEKY